MKSREVAKRGMGGQESANASLRVSEVSGGTQVRPVSAPRSGQAKPGEATAARRSVFMRDSSPRHVSSFPQAEEERRPKASGCRCGAGFAEPAIPASGRRPASPEFRVHPSPPCGHSPASWLWRFLRRGLPDAAFSSSRAAASSMASWRGLRKVSSWSPRGSQRHSPMSKEAPWSKSGAGRRTSPVPLNTSKSLCSIHEPSADMCPHCSPYTT